MGDPRWWVGEEVPNDQFVTQAQAAETLGLRSDLTVGAYIGRGILIPATSTEGESGVTRASLDAEIEWQRTASGLQRLRRKVAGVFHFL